MQIFLSLHRENHTVGFEISRAYPKLEDKLVYVALKLWKVRVNFPIIGFVTPLAQRLHSRELELE